MNKAEELHAITLLQYDSFVEGTCFASNSQVYKTTTNIIEREALAACVPEWQPRVTPQYLLLDDETIQWILADVTEEVESNDP